MNINIIISNKAISIDILSGFFCFDNYNILDHIFKSIKNIDMFDRSFVLFERRLSLINSVNKFVINTFSILYMNITNRICIIYKLISIDHAILCKSD